MFDEIPGKCRAIRVWQMDGNDGTATVLATTFIDRTPHGACIQWAGIQSTKETVDPRPSDEHYACIHALHEGSAWVHRSGFSPDSRNRNGLQHTCKDCRKREARLKTLVSVPMLRTG